MCVNTVKIFVGYHKPYQLLKSDIFEPIHLGRAVADSKAKDGTNDVAALKWLEDNMIGDDTGNNISKKNRRYCELTGIYWIWKNYEKIGNPAYIGFMHYRRHFIFNDAFDKYSPRELHEKTYSKINVGFIFNGYEEKFGLTDKEIAGIISKYDAILPLKCDLSKRNIHSITDDYVNYIEGTRKKDLAILLKIVKKKYPEHGEILQKRLNSADKRCFQSFVLRKEIFFDYCSFLFDILDDVDNKIDVSKYSVNGKRTIGYLGEILFDTYMFKLVNDKKYRVKELGMTFLAANSLPKPIKNRTAIVQLAYSDYESLEISLANFSKYFDDTTKFFVLQNGRGTYDTERTYRVAKRYEKLFPNNIEVVDDIPPQKPYRALMELFNSKRMDNFDYICKVDDDVFPLDPQWFEKLCSSYEKEYSLHGENLAYVTGLVNNNPYGFKQIIDRNSELSKEYYSEVARTHIAGYPEKSDYYVSSFIKSGARILNYDDYIVLNSLRESRRSSYIILDITKEGLILLDFKNDVRLLVKALAVPFVELFKTKNILIDVTLIPYNGVITYDSFIQQNLIEMPQINLTKDKIETYDELQFLQTEEEFLEFYKNIKN